MESVKVQVSIAAFKLEIEGFTTIGGRLEDTESILEDAPERLKSCGIERVMSKESKECLSPEFKSVFSVRMSLSMARCTQLYNWKGDYQIGYRFYEQNQCSSSRMFGIHFSTFNADIFKISNSSIHNQILHIHST